MENPMSSPSQIILCETSISSTSDSSSDNSPTLTEEDLVESYNPLDPINLCSETPSSIMSFKYPSLEYRDADTSVEESITAYQNQDSSMMNPWSEDIDEMHTKPCLLEPKIEFVDEELYNDASDLTLGKPFHFKVAIRRENAPDEKAQIRRFSTTFDDTPIFPHLCTTLRTICPDLRDETFTLHWQDTDGDDVLVASCLELREALSMMKYHRLIRFDLTVHNANGQAGRVARIFNGKYDEAHDNRYYVALLKVSPNDITSHWCGGAIINSHHILTAAHCVYGLSKDELIIRSGWGDSENEMLTSSTFHKIAKITYPKDYFNSTCRQHQHDIAVKRKFDLSDDSHYSKLYLPERDNDYEYYDVKFTGFGAEKFAGVLDKATNKTVNVTFKNPTILKYFETQVVALEDCKNQLPIIVTNTNICTKAKIGAFTCTGDNGGPLVVGDVVIGVKNKHSECNANQPELYTRVSDYLGFIEKVLSHEYSSDIAYEG
ncbi:hypothetical protein QAD02_010292 [Eretmocerus hayati]|uniref:Uncharacterized protein n=1 Tax=Eretmocerus hayati TaxID=131215 RepID=A0ACC2NE62_9HYME|nr:hypothetical protein QAD02_010292 [Eretmocerus hayati]